jgi:magnesium chelatase subunit D
VHVRRAAELALAHRRQRDPLNPQKADPESLQNALDLAPENPEPEPDPPEAGPDAAGDRGGDDRDGDGDDGAGELEEWGPGLGGPGSGGDGAEGGAGDGGGGDGGGPGRPGAQWPRRTGSGLPLPPRTATPLPARIPREAYELPQRTAGPTAGSIDTRPGGTSPEDIALVASLLRGALREHVRAGREGVLLCLVVDASGSMRARKRSARVKGALLDLLRDAYARRDRVALISFRGSSAELLVAPGAPLAQAALALRELQTGGRTPLAEGLEAATDLIRREAMREPGRASIALVLTDGRSPDPHGRITAAAAGLGRVADAVRVIDTEAGTVRLGMAQRLAEAAGGERFGFAA